MCLTIEPQRHIFVVAIYFIVFFFFASKNMDIGVCSPLALAEIKDLPDFSINITQIFLVAFSAVPVDFQPLRERKTRKDFFFFIGRTRSIVKSARSHAKILNAIFKNSLKITHESLNEKHNIKWKVNLCRSRSVIFQYPGDYGFLATANKNESYLTGRMRAHWIFRGVLFPGAWGRTGRQWVKVTSVFKPPPG